LALFLEFFPNGDTTQQPAVTNPNDIAFILANYGFSLMILGRLSGAAPFFIRNIEMRLEMKDWMNASRTYKNLAELYLQTGQLKESNEVSLKSLNLLRKVGSLTEERDSITELGWNAHLRGDFQTADDYFQEAERLERQIDTKAKYLYSRRGAWHADYLIYTGHYNLARLVNENNQKISEEHHAIVDLSRIHRIFGDLEVKTGNIERALEFYNSAVQMAQSTSRRDVLIESLLARGKYLNLYSKEKTIDAFRDISLALNFSRQGGYKIYLSEALLAMALIDFEKDLFLARDQTIQALELSKEMGYFWGSQDAERILFRIDERVSQGR